MSTDTPRPDAPVKVRTSAEFLVHITDRLFYQIRWSLGKIANDDVTPLQLMLTMMLDGIDTMITHKAIGDRVQDLFSVQQWMRILSVEDESRSQQWKQLGADALAFHRCLQAFINDPATFDA